MCMGCVTLLHLKTKIWIALRAFTSIISMTISNEVAIHIFDARYHNSSEVLKT